MDCSLSCLPLKKNNTWLFVFFYLPLIQVQVALVTHSVAIQHSNSNPDSKLIRSKDLEFRALGFGACPDLTCILRFSVWHKLTRSCVSTFVTQLLKHNGLSRNILDIKLKHYWIPDLCKGSRLQTRTQEPRHARMIAKTVKCNSHYPGHIRVPPHSFPHLDTPRYNSSTQKALPGNSRPQSKSPGQPQW